MRINRVINKQDCVLFCKGLFNFRNTEMLCTLTNAEQELAIAANLLRVAKYVVNTTHLVSIRLMDKPNVINAINENL